jgi:hypothetical protein
MTSAATRSPARSRTSFAASAAALFIAACGGSGGSPAAEKYAGDCTATGARGQLTFAPGRGQAGPAFLLSDTQGAGDYDAQVNAVDAQGRYGPDARGTVHLDASGRAGSLSTPDLQTADGETVHYGGAWRCASFTSVSRVPEPTGGPSTPR